MILVGWKHNQSLVLPALVETKPVSGISTQYYVDEAMNIVKVVRVRVSTELAGFEYERDGKNRITEIREHHGGQGNGG